jgi:hypothetical protein
MALPDLLAALCSPQETGVLELTRHGVTKSIYIQEGRIVFATSTDPDDRLGEVLLRKGMLSIRDFEEAVSKLSPRKRLGALLVEMGHLKPEELVRAVIEQVKGIVFDLFLWFDGEYRFTRGELPSREVITLKLSTPEVILGGIHRIGHWSRILRGVGGLDTWFQVSPSRDRVLEQMQLRAEHAAILQALSQPTSVRDLCRRGLMPDFDMCRMLWAFRVIALIEPVKMAAPARARAQAAAPQAAPATRATAAAAPEKPARSGPAPASPSAASSQQTRPARSPAAPSAAAPAAAPAARPAAAPAAPPRTARSDESDVPPGPPGDPRDLLEAALNAETDPAANAMTMAIPAFRPQPGEGAGPDGSAEAVLEVVDDSEPGLEVVEEQPEALEVVEVADQGGETPPAVGAGAQAGELDEARVEAAVASFNDRHRRLYALLRTKGGKKADEICRRCLQAIQKDLPGLFNDLAPAEDGGFDPDMLKMNIFAFGVLDFAAGLQMLIERELEVAASVLGPEVRRQIAAELKAVPA